MNECWNKAFESMAKKALELEATGVCGIAKKEANGMINLKLYDCGKGYDEWGNFYSLVCAKMMQIVRTGEASGTESDLKGEFLNFIGGIFEGDYFVAFSGAEGHVDLEIAKVGLDILVSE